MNQIHKRTLSYTPNSYRSQEKRDMESDHYEQLIALLFTSSNNISLNPDSCELYESLHFDGLGC